MPNRRPWRSRSRAYQVLTLVARVAGSDESFLRSAEANLRLASERLHRRAYDEWASSVEASFDEQSTTPRPKCLVAFHYQPEAAISSFVDPIWEDQVSIVDYVTDLLGQGWDVVVKDHPVQTVDPLFRSRLWMQSLSRNPRIRLVRPSAPSEGLLPTADLVVTISGTAGWEAIRLGIPVVVFGAAWYREAPGVIQSSSLSGDPTEFAEVYERARSAIADATAVDRWLADISDRLAVGYVGHLDMWQSRDGFRALHQGEVTRQSELSGNAEVVAGSLARIIREVLPRTVS